VPTTAEKITAWMDQFFEDIRRLDKSAFSLTTGFRAAAFAIAPIIAGFAIQQPALLFDQSLYIVPYHDEPER